MNKLIRNRDFLRNRNGKLFVEGVAVETLAKKFGAPLYVCSEKRILENVRRVQSALTKFIPNSQLFYAVKANNNLSVLSLMKKEGLGLDAAGIFEIQLAKNSLFWRFSF